MSLDLSGNLLIGYLAELRQRLRRREERIERTRPLPCLVLLNKHEDLDALTG